LEIWNIPAAFRFLSAAARNISWAVAKKKRKISWAARVFFIEEDLRAGLPTPNF
jgi:hypothetical protein